MTRNAVDRYFTSVNSHDWAGLRGALAEDIIRIGPNGDDTRADVSIYDDGEWRAVMRPDCGRKQQGSEQRRV